jgi:hypothetical protein
MASCGNCGTENKENVKFCKACGTLMAASVAVPVACHSCAAPLLPGAKFCKKCGTAVVSPLPAAVQAPVAPVEVEAPAKIAIAEPDPTPMTVSPAADLDAVKSTDPVVADISVAKTPSIDTSANSEVPMAPTSSQPLIEPTPKKSHHAIVIGIALMVVLAGAAGYWWFAKKPISAESMAADESPKAGGTSTAVPAGAPSMSSTPDSGPVAPAPLPAPVASATVQPQQSAVVPQPATTVPMPSSRVASTQSAISKPVAAVAPRAVQPTSPAVPDAMARNVLTLLSKADGYIGNHQYDKAIATAESVLELDPGNRAAASMINKAKARQLDALKSGSTLD